jgi:hypothetical protein
MIKPTIGRIVHFYGPGGNHYIHQRGCEPVPAMIVGVHDDRLVNLVVFDFLGHCWPLPKVPLLQTGDVINGLPSMYCCWMPYQVGQATKTEELQARLDGHGISTPNEALTNPVDNGPAKSL